MGPHGGDGATQIPDNITVICSPEEMDIYQALIESADTALANDAK